MRSRRSSKFIVVFKYLNCFGLFRDAYEPGPPGWVKNLKEAFKMRMYAMYEAQWSPGNVGTTAIGK
jgi:hypothetical protein